MDARAPGARHLLTGYAGSGKTTLMQHLAREWTAAGLSVVLTAPTHKAVAVLASKLRAAGIEGVDCRTIFSLLELKPTVVKDRQIFTREKGAKACLANVVVVDECSMLGADLMAHIRRHLPLAFVLFVGDPAQLPPVGEQESESFATKSRSHLDTIVRQGADNPLLEVASALRQSQGGPMDWSWCRSAKNPPLGVFLPGANADAWMEKAFTSDAFEADPDSFRYLAWTNARVAEVNQRVRQWRYGERARVPFVPGEFALIRSPVIIHRQIVFNTNEEAEVVGIQRDTLRHYVEPTAHSTGWWAEVPSWRVLLARPDASEVPVHLCADTKTYNAIVAKITDEAAEDRARWKHLHDFKGALANLQSIYAMTVHTSQGSTFRNAFVDLSDIRRRAKTNVLETQQMLYVAATRPSHALMLVGA